MLQHTSRTEDIRFRSRLHNKHILVPHGTTYHQPAVSQRVIRISTLFSPLLNLPNAASPSCIPSRSAMRSLNSGCEDPPAISLLVRSQGHTKHFALSHDCGMRSQTCFWGPELQVHLLAAAVFVTQSVCLGFWDFEPVTAGDCRGDEEFWQVLVSTGVSGSGAGTGCLPVSAFGKQWCADPITSQFIS